MPNQEPPSNPSMLEIRPRFTPLAFLLYFFTPFYSINGGPAMTGRWKQNAVLVPPGRYEVAVWVNYLFRPRMGFSSITVDVPPRSAVVITWRAPWTIFGAGRIAITEGRSFHGQPDGVEALPLH